MPEFKENKYTYCIKTGLIKMVRETPEYNRYRKPLQRDLQKHSVTSLETPKILKYQSISITAQKAY